MTVSWAQALFLLLILVLFTAAGYWDGQNPGGRHRFGAIIILVIVVPLLDWVGFFG